MNRRPIWYEFLRDTTVPLATVSAIGVAGIAIFIDFTTWIQLNISILYGLPLILVAPARNRRLLWGLAVALLSTTFVVYYLQTPRGAFSWQEPFFVNRVLASIAVLATAGLLHAWIDAAAALDAQGRLLREQNDRLEAVNEELTRRGQLITLQNQELDRRRRDAEEATKRKSEALTSVSHDMRSPINAISLMAEAIRRTAGDPALIGDVPILATRLQANASSLNDLVTNVLDIAAIDSGRVAVDATECSLNELLNEQCARLLPLAQAKGLKLAVEVPSRTIYLETDRTKLTRVVTNLLSNAIKFTETGEVRVAGTVTSHGVVEICVRDTGAGIAAEDVSRIFEEFARVGGPGSEPKRGWGLGLAISRRLVEMLGGTIAVESQPNVGSAFTIRLASESRSAEHPPRGVRNS